LPVIVELPELPRRLGGGLAVAGSETVLQEEADHAGDERRWAAAT